MQAGGRGSLVTYAHRIQLKGDSLRRRAGEKKNA